MDDMVDMTCRDLRIGNFRSNRISNRIRGSRLHVQCRLSCGSCVCALATAVQYIGVVNINLNYERRKGWCFCWTVSERSLWYDGTRHVRPIRNFRISASLSNRIRIGTYDSNSKRISKLRRSLMTCQCCHRYQIAVHATVLYGCTQYQ